MDAASGRIAPHKNGGGRASPVLCYGLAAAALVVLLYLLRDLLGLAALSTVWAYLFLGLQKKLERRFSPTVSAVLTLLIPACAAILLLWAFVPGLIRDLSDLAVLVPGKIAEWEDRFRNVLARFGLQGTIRPSLLREEAVNRIGKIAAAAGQKGRQGALYVLSPVLTFYLLRDRGKLWEQCLYCLPPEKRRDVSCLLLRIHDRWQQFIRAQLVSSCVVGALTLPGFWLFAVPYPVGSAFLMALLDLIPTFGPLLASAAIGLLTLTAEPGRIWAALSVCFAAQQLENLCITPLVLGDSLQLHPACVMLLIVGGGLLAGAAGMLGAVPVWLCLREILLWREEHTQTGTCKFKSDIVQ